MEVYNQPCAPYRHPHLYPFRLNPTRPQVSLRSTPLQYTGQSLQSPIPGFIREMSNALQITPYTPVSAHGNAEGLPSAQEKKSLLPPVFSSFRSLIPQHPFLSAIVAAIVLAGIVAGVVNQSYIRDKQDPYLQVPPNKNGASARCHSPQLGSWLTGWHIL